MSDNSNLCRAKAAKFDECYTRLADIEAEFGQYARNFRDKVVYCNADDPFQSNFVRYFVRHFNDLGLRGLISTNYRPKTVQATLDPDAELPKLPTGRARCLRLERVPHGAMGIEDVPLCGVNSLTEMVGDGDFRSMECARLLDECDIVCTNPPFSLFREYFSQLMDHEKDFLIIGALCAACTKATFPAIRAGRAWITPRCRAQFDTPDPLHPVKHIGTACWFSNLASDAPRAVLDLTRCYDPVSYPHYDNLDAIEVSRVKDIPMDYTGIMGVPLPFLFGYNPEQFEIVGITETWGGMASKSYGPHVCIDSDGTMRRCASLTGTPLIEVSHPPEGPYRIIDGRVYVAKFKRILIRNRHPQPTPTDAPSCPVGQTPSQNRGIDTMMNPMESESKKSIDNPIAGGSE